MKALTVISSILAVLALAAAGAVGWTVYQARQAPAEESAPAEPAASRAELAALTADLAGLKGSLDRIEKRVGKLGVPPEGAGVAAGSLLPLLRHMDPSVRRGAVAVLKGLKDPVCLAALRDTASKDVDTSVRSAAFAALTSFGSEEVRGFLVESLKSPQAEVRRQAVEQLTKIARKEDFDALAALFDLEIRKVRGTARPRYSSSSYLPPVLRSTVKALLAADPDRSLPYVLRAMVAAPSDYTIRNSLRAALTHENLPKLLELAAKLPEPAERRTGTYSRTGASVHSAVLYALGNLRDKRALPFLKKMLDCKDYSLRGLAAKLLATTIGKEAYEPLAARLKKELAAAETLPAGTTPHGAQSLIEALRTIGDKRACALFIKAALSKHSYVRSSAANALRTCVDPARGPDIYKLWKSTKDTTLKRNLQMVLKYAKAYGYIWDMAANDFRRNAPVVKGEEF